MITAKASLEQTKKYWKRNIDKDWESRISNHIFEAAQRGERYIVYHDLMDSSRAAYLKLHGYNVTLEPQIIISW